ncbi:MAG TPA: hypothetical protein VHW43_10355 [Puia sp.]|nr:hypothetical protein [Puia sp.]
MIAHNRQALDNRDIQQEAKEALAKSVITQMEYNRILEAHPFKLYTPNVFIRIGLFLLTVLAVACGLGLFMLITMGSGEHGIGIILILWGIAAYVGLEFVIHSRGMYRAGVDDALLWLAGGLLFGGINLLANNLSLTLETWIILIVATWGLFRYADPLMALTAYGALIYLIFHLIITSGAVGSIIVVTMILSAIAYFLLTRLSTVESLRHYHACLSLLQMAALLTFYLSGNYYVVQNIDASIHGETAPVAFSPLWWAFTGIVPVGYVAAGIRKKDTILLWTGLALVAGAIFTIRYYYHILPAETAMIIGGGILLAGAYGLIRYLHTPKHGFTSTAPEEPHVLQNLPVESLLLAETFKSIPTQPTDQSPNFGGGSGGGAGAGGTY